MADFQDALLTSSEYLKPFAKTLTHDTEDAKDLYQETMYRAFANKAKYNDGTNLRAWLYTIMRNIFINNYRTKLKQKSVFITSENENSLLVANDAIANISKKEMIFFINKLPEIFRVPFLLYFNGYKYQEISEALNEPLGTIKSRIHFARKLLKTQIQRL